MGRASRASVEQAGAGGDVEKLRLDEVIGEGRCRLSHRVAGYDAATYEDRLPHAAVGDVLLVGGDPRERAK